MTVKPTVSGGFNWNAPDTTPAAQKSEATDVNGYAQFQWAEGPQHHLRCAGHRRSEGRLHLRATGYEQRLDLLRNAPDSATVETVKGTSQILRTRSSTSA